MPICTQEEELKYKNELQAALLTFGKDVLENFTNVTNGVIAEHVGPLLNASNRIMTLALDSFRPPIMSIMKFGMHKVMKPKKKYSNDFASNFNRSVSELVAAAKNLSQVAKAIFFGSLGGVDETFNRSLAAAPSDMPSLPVIGVPTNGEQVRDYLLKKALPIIIAESFNPTLAKSVSLLISGQEVEKAIYSIVDPVEAMLMEPPAVPLPQRQCATCMEHYLYQVDNVESGCVLERCDSVIMDCTNGSTVSCVRGFGPCLKCHSEMLAQLDQCFKTFGLPVIGGRLGQIVDTVGQLVVNFSRAVHMNISQVWRAALPYLSGRISNVSEVLTTHKGEHYNSFMTRLSESIVGPVV